MSILEFQPTILVSAYQQPQRFHELHSSIELPNPLPMVADCLHLRVERGFRVQWRPRWHFSASRKITSLHSQTEGLLRLPSLTVFWLPVTADIPYPPYLSLRGLWPKKTKAFPLQYQIHRRFSKNRRRRTSKAFCGVYIRTSLIRYVD